MTIASISTKISPNSTGLPSKRMSKKIAQYIEKNLPKAYRTVEGSLKRSIRSLKNSKITTEKKFIQNRLTKEPKNVDFRTV